MDVVSFPQLKREEWVINDFSLHENEAKLIFILSYKPLNFLLFILLITSRHIILITIIHAISGHNPRIHPFPSAPVWKSTSSCLITHSQHSLNHWLRVLCLRANFYLLSCWQANHLILYFIALMHGLHAFLYHWNFHYYFFFMFIWLPVVNYKLQKYRDHFFHHFRLLKYTINYGEVWKYLLNESNTCWILSTNRMTTKGPIFWNIFQETFM